MDINELLLTSSESSQQFSACLWDYKTSNIHRVFKNGGTITSKCLEMIGQDYILGAEQGKPLLHVWPVNSQECSKNIRLILSEPTSCLAVCPKNTYLAVGINCKLYIWQLSFGKLLSVQQKHYQQITSIKFSSDCKYLLTGGEEGLVIVYNFVDLISFSNNFLTQNDIGQVEPVYTKKDQCKIIDIHIGNFGKKSRFATVSEAYICQIYRLSDGEPLQKLVLSGDITAFTFDGLWRQLFLGKNNGNINQIDLKSLPNMSTHIDEKQSLTFHGHTKKIVCIAINITNTILASGSEDNFVYIWDIRSREKHKTIEHKSPITNIKFVLAYQNFSTENFKPHVILKNLERSLDSSSFTVSQIQQQDIKVSDDEDLLEEENYTSDILIENVKLRSINAQLYRAALEIRKQFKSV